MTVVANMRTKADYKRALAVVSVVINEYDPYCLLSGGAPKDEFEGEIAEIVANIPNIKSQADAARLIARTFRKWLIPGDFPDSSCAKVGKKLFAALCEAGLLERKRETHSAT